MVQAMINISEDTNQILNTVKAKYGLKDKSAAIDFIVDRYGDEFEPELRPEYARKLLRISKQKPIEVGTVENLRKRYESSLRSSHKPKGRQGTGKAV